MEKKNMMYTQRRLVFDALTQFEREHVAEATSQPPPDLSLQSSATVGQTSAPLRSNTDPKPIVVSDKIIIVPVGFRQRVEAPVVEQQPTFEPFQFDEFRAVLREFAQGGISFATYRQQFERVWKSQDALKAELLNRYKAKELAVLASRFGSWQARRSTKDENALHVVSKMLSFFVLDGTVSYRPMSGETYQDAVRKTVLAVSEGEYYRHFEKRQEADQAHEKALSEPETLVEFNLFTSHKGDQALSEEQFARYDQLKADLTRQLRSDQAAKSKVEKFASYELQSLTFVRKVGCHDKRGCPLHIVQLESRVEREAFTELNRKAKMLGGWYSSFKQADAGFQFLDSNQADQFCGLLQGDVDRSGVLEASKERREQSAAERLHELAAELSDRADETITRSNDSLQNTVRRAGIQAGVRGRAYADQAMARTLHSIAEALSRGEAKYLDGIRHKSQVDTLERVLYRAKWARVRARQQAEADGNSNSGRIRGRLEDEPINADTVRFAEFPFPTIYRQHIDELTAAASGRPGLKLIAAKLRKRASFAGEYVVMRQESDLALLTDFISRAKSAGLNVERVASEVDEFQRLVRANITDNHELRAALRELLKHRAEARGDDPVKTAERELIGKDLPGFFPTPRPVIEQMLDRAEVTKDHRVLEPSCGKGDIVEALKERIPELLVHAIERNYSLGDVLSAKGLNVEFDDFLEHQGTYDRIIMNPPFENGQDTLHVRHAYSLLAPGGRLVAVTSTGPFFRSDKQSAEFREWLAEIHSRVEELPDDAFQGREAFRQTGVRTRLLTFDKE